MKNTLRPQIYNNSPTKILYIHVINGQHRRLQTSSNYTSRPREFLLHTCIYIYFRSNSFETPNLVGTFSVNKADNPPSCSKCQNVSFFFCQVTDFRGKTLPRQMQRQTSVRKRKPVISGHQILKPKLHKHLYLSTGR